MNARLRYGMLMPLLAVLLLVSADGGGLHVPRRAQRVASVAPAPAPAVAVQASVPVETVPAETVAAAVDVKPQQSQDPAAEADSLVDEARRIRQDRLSCVADAGGSADLFASKSWYVPPPPPPPPKPAPPPKPTAPPLPFAFMGSYQESDGRQIFFLTRGERLYTVSTGDVIDGIYRVEDVSAGQLGIIYLPLNIRQSMSVGETS